VTDRRKGTTPSRESARERWERSYEQGDDKCDNN
jgi:hypothetical protein